MADILIEWNGRVRRVTLEQLYEFAQQGIIRPETRIWYNGRESTCAQVKGIVFSNEISVPADRGWSRHQVISVPQGQAVPRKKVELTQSGEWDGDLFDDLPSCTPIPKVHDVVGEKVSPGPCDIVFDEDKRQSTKRIIWVTVFVLLVFIGLSTAVVICCLQLYDRVSRPAETAEVSVSGPQASVVEVAHDEVANYETTSFLKNADELPRMYRGHDLVRVFRTIEVRNDENVVGETPVEHAKRIAEQELKPLYGHVTVFSTFAFAADFQYHGKPLDDHSWKLFLGTKLKPVGDKKIFKLESDKQVSLEDYLELIQPQDRNKVHQSQFANYGVCLVPPRDLATTPFPESRSLQVDIRAKGADAPVGAIALLMVGRLCREAVPGTKSEASKPENTLRFIGESIDTQTNYVFMSCPAFWIYNNVTGEVYARVSYEQLLHGDVKINVEEGKKK